MRLTLEKIAELVEGQVHGDPQIVITGVAGLETATPSDITFIRDEKAMRMAADSKAGAFIVPTHVPELPGAQIQTRHPVMAFGKLLWMIEKERFSRGPGIHPTALIAASAKVAEDCSIGAYCVIEDGVELGPKCVLYPHVFVGRGSSIGDGSLVYPNVCIREYVRVGKSCILHANSVIGDDGFGYFQHGAKHMKIPQVGNVEIGDEVEIGCCCTVDRAALDKTRIGNGVKIDNHSHLAHNVQVGDDSILIAYAKVAGSVKIGRNVTIAEDVGISDHVDIGDRAIICGGTSVVKSVPEGQVVLGAPAKPISLEKRILVVRKKLPEMRKQLLEMAKRLKALEERIASGVKDEPDSPDSSGPPWTPIH